MDETNLNQIYGMWSKTPIRKPRISKVVVNFSVGASGPPLEKARKLCEQLTNQKPIDCQAKMTIRQFSIRKGEPISLKVTLRGEKAKEFVKKVFWAKEDRVLPKNFDNYGNLSLGIADHLDLPNIRYDPQIGSYGFDTTIVLERAGYRIKDRRRQKRKINSRQKLSKEEAMAFFIKEYGVKVSEE